MDVDPQDVPGTPLIELRKVSRTFATEGGVEVHALRAVSLTIHSGEFVAIKGQSGSGKTTLMNIIGCLDQVTSGEYLYAGSSIASFDADQLAWLRREAFGFVFQQYNLLPTATAVENVEVPAIYAGLSVGERHQRSRELLATLGLGDRTGHRPNQLSGGQQQRVSIARALMNGGQIILADEPTGALDSESGKELMALLSDLSSRGHTIVLITHDEDVAEHADRQIEMFDGEIVRDTGPGKAAAVAPSGESSSASADDAHVPSPSETFVATTLLSEMGEAVRMAARSLRANIFRTFLTLLGIVIGVASVITMLAIGEGAKQRIVAQITAMGADVITVYPRWRRGQRGALLPLDIAEALVAEVPNVKYALPGLGGGATVRYGSRDDNVRIVATSSDFPAVRKWPVATGVFFTHADSEDLAPVAVIGASVVDYFFPDEDPLGRYILIRDVPFLVIGTLTERGTSGDKDEDPDNVVYLPLRSGALRLLGSQYLHQLTVIVEDTAFINQAEDDIKQWLFDRQGTTSYYVRNSVEKINEVADATRTFTLLLGSIAAISLLVGGIGIMNIMLVSVTERTREIGVRMATGARQRDILLQFLIEAIVVSAVGGFCGLGLGFVIGGLLSLFEVPIAFQPGPMVMAFACAAAIGLVFGFTPARNASRLNPVAALASE